MSEGFTSVTKHQRISQERWLSLDMAVREVVAFEKKFGQQHLSLACHAALPLIVTTKMLNLIHCNFLDYEAIPWYAETDFLLSPLCRQVDTMLFEVEPRIREVLLTILEERFGRARLVGIADFLLVYLEKQQELQPYSATSTTIRWIALSYFAPDEAVTEMTSFLQNSLSPEQQEGTDIQSQFLIATTMEIVAEPLEQSSLKQEYQTLIYDSRVLAEMLYNDDANVGKEQIQHYVDEKHEKRGIALLSPAMQQWLLRTHEVADVQDIADVLDVALDENSTQSETDQHNDPLNVPDILLPDDVQRSSTPEITTPEEEKQDLIMSGDLQTLGLQSLLKMLALAEKTGTLFVSSGPAKLSVSLRKGRIVGVQEDGVPQPDILGMLCLINKLDPPRAQMIRERSQGDMQLALVMLVERGWMSAEEMQRRLEFAVIQPISHALRWVDGRFAFHRRLVSPEGKLQPLDVDLVLLAALRQADEWEEITGEGVRQLTRTTVVRWQPEISKDVSSLGLSQESIDVLCLSNGELPLQVVSLALMMPEARVARLMMQLLNFHLIEVVDTALETELQQDLSNIIIRAQHKLAQQRQPSNPEQHLRGLITTLAECINGLLIHHGSYARSLRDRGRVPTTEIVHYLERRFSQHLRTLAVQQYPILETATFSHGQLGCSDILTLNKIVMGEQLEEFYWEAVQGLAAFLRIVFSDLIRDEIGNSDASRQLAVAWRIFLSEVDHEMQQYQTYRAHQRRGKYASKTNLPNQEEFPMVVNDGPRAGDAIKKGPAVLVVDDSPTVRKIIQIALLREHIRVITAGDGLSALASVADEMPAVILLDIRLPRMDGYQICQIIRKNERFRHIPIIMLSVMDGLFDKMRGRLAGATEYMTKPFHKDELIGVVKKHLQES